MLLKDRMVQKPNLLLENQWERMLFHPHALLGKTLPKSLNPQFR